MVNFAIVAALWGVTLAATAASGLDIVWSSFLGLFAAILLAGALAAYCAWRDMPRLARIARNLALVTGAFFAALPLSYAAASGTAPIADGWLRAADRAIGFDWWSYIAFFDSHPLFAQISHHIYMSMFAQIAMVTLVLSVQAPAVAARFVAAVTLALALTCLVSIATPAVGVYGFLDVDLARFPNLHPATTFQAVEPLAQLRAGTLPPLSADDSIGIIAFPSFHCAAGVLLIWAGWHLPAARWPLAIVNILMIASTPVEGAHYLVDGLAGAAVALAAIAAATLLHRPRAARAPWTLQGVPSARLRRA
jgi:membrane-associated phospholipid phosphatase